MRSSRTRGKTSWSVTHGRRRAGPGRIPRGLGSDTLDELQGYDVKVVKLLGEFVWHTHPDTDELFLELSGRLTIQLRDRDVMLGPNDVVVVPRGVEHCPKASEEVNAVLFEPKGTVNTGDAGGELTSELRELP